MALATFLAFFFYRDGEGLVRAVGRILARLAGDLGDELLVTIDSTVRSVVHSVFGTALAQAAVAVIALLIAGIPGALPPGMATFFLSMVPIGPPLVWGAPRSGCSDRDRSAGQSSWWRGDSWRSAALMTSSSRI